MPPIDGACFEVHQLLGCFRIEFKKASLNFRKIMLHFIFKRFFFCIWSQKLFVNLYSFQICIDKPSPTRARKPKGHI